MWRKAKNSLTNDGPEMIGITNTNTRTKTTLDKVHIFREGHRILRNLNLTFDWHYRGQK